MIQIYKPETADFSNNGDMTLFPTSCELTSEINGAWELTMSHPLDSEGRWKYIEQEAVIACPTFQGDKQLFRIDIAEVTDTSVEVTAYPIFFDSADDLFLMDVRPTSKNGQDALDIMTAGSKYSGQSDITTGGTAYFVRRNMMDALNGEDTPTFVQVWGGEILYDNYTVIVNERIGGEYGLEIRYGKNMQEVHHKVDMSDVVTRIVPVAYNGRTMSGASPWVDSPNISKYAKIYTREVTFDDVKLAEDANEDDAENGIIVCENQAELDAALTQKCEDMYEAGADLPTVTIDVSMVDLEHTREYEDFKDLVKVALGDTVKCINYKLGIETEARVIKLTWDCIRNRSSEITLGDYEYQYFNELTSSLQAVGKIIGPGDTVIAERVSGVLNAINTQLRYQKNVAQRQDVRAILFEDTDETSQTYGAMCLGTQGFQIADTRTADGRDWDWTTAFTAKGGYANTLIAGLLSDKTGRSFWNLDTGEMQLTGTFQQYSTSGKMSVRIRNNLIALYDYVSNGNAVGAVSSLHSESTGVSSLGVYSDGHPIMIGYVNDGGIDEGKLTIRSVFRFDPETPNDTPYIANGSYGDQYIFSNIPGGGIEVQNGIIKRWGIDAFSGWIETEQLHIDVKSGLISSVSNKNTASALSEQNIHGAYEGETTQMRSKEKQEEEVFTN